MTHTATPWPEPEYTNDVGDNDGFFVEWYAIGDFASAIKETDAKFIVRACNAHEANEVLKASVANYLAALDDWDNSNKAERRVKLNEAVMRDALAKAGAA